MKTWMWYALAALGAFLVWRWWSKGAAKSSPATLDNSRLVRDRDSRLIMRLAPTIGREPDW